MGRRREGERGGGDIEREGGRQERRQERIALAEAVTLVRNSQR